MSLGRGNELTTGAINTQMRTGTATSSETSTPIAILRKDMRNSLTASEPRNIPGTRGSRLVGEHLSARPPRATQMLRCESSAKNIAMAKSVASVVICEACGERVAEIVADDGRALCSRCHLTESRAKTPREEKPDPDQ